MLPVASPPKYRKPCGSVPEADTLQKEFHSKGLGSSLMIALLIVDIQTSSFGRYDASLLTRINRRILEAQEQKQEVIYIQNTKRLRSGVFTDAFADGLLVATDHIFRKEQANSFSCEALPDYLESKGV